MNNLTFTKDNTLYCLSTHFQTILTILTADIVVDTNWHAHVTKMNIFKYSTFRLDHLSNL